MLYGELVESGAERLALVALRPPALVRARLMLYVMFRSDVA